ncbi:MAG TPA: TolC family protein [Bryobacteraceae bacterium]|jgi:cobalt-zinc-cadmium efflux system outer membrane protein|nr:TolC family protein [Bryobacteraceae bacterium]
MSCFVRVSAFVLAIAPALLSQTPLTLQDAVSLALASHPALDAATARQNVAAGLRKQAGLSPNPRLIVQLENTRFWGTPPFSYPQDTQTYAYVAQTVETAGKRGRRVDLASENVRSSELGVELQRRQIASRVASAYWIAAGSARVRDLLREEVTSFERLVEFNRNRVREGATPEVDLLRTEVERDRLTGLAGVAAQDAERTRIALVREMGKTEFPAVEFTDSLERPDAVEPAQVSQVLDRRIDMMLAREGVEQARANLRLQQANARTDPDLQLGYERIGGFDTIYAAAQIPLPIWNRNQGQIEAATADIRVAESSLALTEAAIRSELENARVEYAARQKLLNDTLRPMRERADEVYRITDAAYRETGSDILRLLDAERVRIETQTAYTRALAELQQSAVALKTAQGDLP